MLERVDDQSAGDAFRPYRGGWQLADARRYFARPPQSPSVAWQAERTDSSFRWREVTFAIGASSHATATVVSPTSVAVQRGVVLAHGGFDDGRRFFLSEAAALAADGAAVILPVTRIRQNEGADRFATDARTAVLTERAALDVLLESGAPPGELSFLGHSMGGAWGAILSAVEPRLARIVIFANGAGSLARSAMVSGLARGGDGAEELAAIAEWFDLGHFVGVRRRATLLIQHGRFDRTVPMEAAAALFAAAAEPRLWAEYDWDHGLDADPQARNDRAHFLLDCSWSP